MWVCIVKREEAVKRIVERDGKTQEEAEKRLDSQMSTRERIERANVVFCTQWSGDYTQKQVERAWADLLARLPKGEGQERRQEAPSGEGGATSPKSQI